MVLLFAAAGPAQHEPALEPALRELLQSPVLAGARAGVAVVEAGNGRTLLEHDADRGFLPASNLKLISAAVALQTLGPAFTFTTRVVAAAAPQDGVLEGDLWLLGDGDPTFGSWRDGDPMADVRALAEQVFQRGVRTVRGGVVGIDDCQADEHRGRGWQHDYLEQDYAAPFGGLCFAGSVCQLVLAGSGSEGSLAACWQRPAVGELLVAALPRCAAAGAATALRCVREPYQEALRVAGTIAADCKEQRLLVAVVNPTRYAARALHTALRARGIVVLGAAADGDEVASSPPATTVLLGQHRSQPLAELLRQGLKDSVNLEAEQWFRTAARVAGAGTRSEDCERHALAVLEQLGVPTAGMVLADGSGLSRRNLVQPRQLVALLCSAWAASWRQPFVAALPVAGIDGTLQSRFAAGPARGVVQAKTGYIAQVVCLSGYVPAKEEDSKPLCFSVMLNHGTGGVEAQKAVVDAFVDRLVAFWRDSASAR